MVELNESKEREVKTKEPKAPPKRRRANAGTTGRSAKRIAGRPVTAQMSVEGSEEGIPNQTTRDDEGKHDGPEDPNSEQNNKLNATAQALLDALQQRVADKIAAIAPTVVEGENGPPARHVLAERLEGDKTFKPVQSGHDDPPPAPAVDHNLDPPKPKAPAVVGKVADVGSGPGASGNTGGGGMGGANAFFPTEKTNPLLASRDGMGRSYVSAIQDETRVNANSGQNQPYSSTVNSGISPDDAKRKEDLREAAWSKVGDQIASNEYRDFSQATLRPRFGIAGVAEVIPPTREQLRSDLEFDLFSVVKPGYGEGSTNKLFLYEQARDDVLTYAGPFIGPGPYLGPLNTQHPMPWQWQTVKHESDINRFKGNSIARLNSMRSVVSKLGAGSMWTQGRDVPEHPVSISSKGLPRELESPYEPAIHHHDDWKPIIDPPGYVLNQRGFKRVFSAVRDPDAPEIMVDNSGPTLSVRRSLEVILP